MRAAHAGHDAEIDLGQADATAFLFGDADVARHGDFEPAANSVTVDSCDNKLGSIFKAREDFVAVESEVVLKREGFAG